MTAIGGNWAAPRNEGAAVVPSDTANIGCTTDGALVYVGTSGDVVAVLAGPGNAVLTFKAYPQGQWLPVLVQRINNTNTSASNMVAVW